MKKVILAIIISILICMLTLYFLYNKPKVAVLCYHNIATKIEKQNFPEEEKWTIDVENFEEHLEYLYKNNYKTLTLDEFYDWKQGKIEIPFKSILITFDDGFLSNYEYAFPLLKKYNMNATVFIIGESIESGIDSWNWSLHDYMSKGIIEKCKEEYPNITFASHSYSLHIKNSVNEKTTEEIEKDIQTLKSNIIDTEYYCYPYGEYSEKMIEALKNNNYKLSFIYGPERKDYRKASREDDNYKIPRLNVSNGMNKTKFALRMLMPF